MTVPKRFALLGDPVAHSKSPAMHAAAYRALGMPHVYQALRVGPDDLAAKVDELRRGQWGGFNVTVPHKLRILEHVDRVHTSARVAGAANTLVRKPDGAVVAYNTDAPALAQEIRALAPERASWSDARALVLGTGGVARSALVALVLDLGVGEVRVRGRGEKVHAFVADVSTLLREAGGAARVVGEPLAPSEATEAFVAVVVQATSAGMHGADPGETVADAVAWEELPPRAVALDVVYAPPETPFLRAAQRHGVRAANGIGMLARQGALAFQLWLGGAPPYNAMLTALL